MCFSTSFSFCFFAACIFLSAFVILGGYFVNDGRAVHWVHVLDKANQARHRAVLDTTGKDSCTWVAISANSAVTLNGEVGGATVAISLAMDTYYMSSISHKIYIRVFY